MGHHRARNYRSPREIRYIVAYRRPCREPVAAGGNGRRSVTINRQLTNLGSYHEDTRHCCRLGRGPPRFAEWVYEQCLSTNCGN